MALGATLEGFWNLEQFATVHKAENTGNLDLNNINGVTVAPGHVGPTAANFNPALMQYFERGGTDLLTFGDVGFTINCWIRLTDKNEFRSIVSKDAQGVSNRDYHLRYNKSMDRFHFFSVTAGVNVHVYANQFGPPPLNTWLMLSAWHDREAKKLCLQVNDGPKDESIYTGTIGSNVSVPFRVGAVAGSGYFAGQIGPLGVWRRVLIPGEIMECWNLGLGKRWNHYPLS